MTASPTATDIHPFSTQAALSSLPYASNAAILTPLSDSVCSPLAPLSTPVLRPPMLTRTDHVHPEPVPPAGPVQFLPGPPQFAYGYPDWRPYRPTCFYCGIRGHTSRFCRRHQQNERLAYSPVSQSRSQPSYDFYSQRFPYAQCSPSPADYQDQHRSPRPPSRSFPTPFRRRSTSPLRPASENTENKRRQFLGAKVRHFRILEGLLIDRRTRYQF